MRQVEAERRAQAELVAKETPPAPTVTSPDTLAPVTEPTQQAAVDSVLTDMPKVSAAEAARVTVETPLYRVTMSAAGGEIISAELLHYETGGIPVQLFAWTPQSASGAASITLAGETRRVPMSNVMFDAYAAQGVEPLANGTVFHMTDEPGQERTVVFRSESGAGHRIERSYTFSSDSYVIKASVRFNSVDYAFVRQIFWGLGPGLRATEAHTQEDYQAMRATVRLGDEYHKRKRGNFQENFSGTLQWAALQTKYFTAVMLPEAPTAGAAQITGSKNENEMTASIGLPAVERRGRVEQAIDLYIGPLDYRIMETLGRGLQKNIDIGFEHVKIFKPVSWAVLWGLLTLHKVIPNYGVVIILLSFFTKVLFYRLTHKSFKSMRDMQSMQPKLQAIKEKYKDDRQRLSQETMKIYKESGVNPLGGCLPMLLQMPVFLALFNVLRNTIQLRRAPFFGWIDDLSQQDVLTHLPISLPIIGSAVSVLPLIMGVSMLVQSKIGGSIAGPSSSTTQPKAFVYMMPIMFTFLFYRMPSGLVIYWIVNTVMSVGQQYYINKGAEREEKRRAENGEIDSKRNQSRSKRPKSKVKEGR